MSQFDQRLRFMIRQYLVGNNFELIETLRRNTKSNYTEYRILL